jgi:hypothetical protein
MGVIGTVITGILVAVLAEDLGAWLRWLTDRLLRRAVGRLPEAVRDRYHEEWAADLEDTPGALAKLVVALGLCRASSMIRRDQSCRSGRVRLGRRVTRALDVLIGGNMLLWLAPLICILAALIKMSSPHRPVLVMDGVMLRFRTRDDTGEADKVGAWLCRTGLDKLPLLINVLRGETHVVKALPFSLLRAIQMISRITAGK